MENTPGFIAIVWVLSRPQRSDHLRSGGSNAHALQAEESLGEAMKAEEGI